MFQVIKNDDLEELKQLGSGSSATVYHGKWGGSDVAIKIIKDIASSSDEDRMVYFSYFLFPFS